MLLGRKEAEERLALFLGCGFPAHGRTWTLSDRSQPKHVAHEIANSLGVAAESVSRSFTRLEREGAIHVERKNVRITDLGQIKAAAHVYTRPPLQWLIKKTRVARVG